MCTRFLPFSRKRSPDLSQFDRCSARLPLLIRAGIDHPSPWTRNFSSFWPWLCGNSQRIQHCSRSTGHQEVSRLREWLRRWDYRGFPSRSSHQWKLLYKETILSFAFLGLLLFGSRMVGIVVGKIFEIDKWIIVQKFLEETTVKRWCSYLYVLLLVFLLLFESFRIYRIQTCYLKIHMNYVYIFFRGIFFFVLLNVLDWKLFYSWKGFNSSRKFLLGFIVKLWVEKILDPWMILRFMRIIIEEALEYFSIRWCKCKRNWKAMDRTCKVREKLKYIIS